MAATVTVEEVKSMGVSAPDVIIDGWIDTAAQADTCIDGLGLTDNQVKLSKLNFIAWQLNAASSGNVTSETSKTGASRSYAVGNGQKDRFETAFRSSPASKCLVSTLTPSYSAFLDVSAVSYE